MQKDCYQNHAFYLITLKPLIVHFHQFTNDDVDFNRRLVKLALICVERACRLLILNTEVCWCFHHLFQMSSDFDIYMLELRVRFFGSFPNICERIQLFKTVHRSNWVWQVLWSQPTLHIVWNNVINTVMYNPCFNSRIHQEYCTEFRL